MCVKSLRTIFLFYIFHWRMANNFCIFGQLGPITNLISNFFWIIIFYFLFNVLFFYRSQTQNFNTMEVLVPNYTKWTIQQLPFKGSVRAVAAWVDIDIIMKQKEKKLRIDSNKETIKKRIDSFFTSYKL